MVDLTALVEDLKQLRKGRGLAASRITERVGSELRAMCEVGEADSPAEIRQKVAKRLEQLAVGLPADLRMAVLAAFGVTPEARLPLYKDRVSWAAARLNRDPRTARRRIDDGIQHLAQLAAVAAVPAAARAEPTAPVSGWHTTELRVTVALDRDLPEVLEQRRIVSDRDELAEVDLAVTLPAAKSAGDLGVSVWGGGTLADRGMESSQRHAFALTLPAPLRRGEAHDFALHFRLPHAQMRPHFACVPRHPCGRFDLRVRFDRRRPPSGIWSLRHVFQRDLDDPVAVGDRLAADLAGEIHLTFQGLTPGLAYGARWAY